MVVLVAEKCLLMVAMLLFDIVSSNNNRALQGPSLQMGVLSGIIHCLLGLSIKIEGICSLLP